MSVARCREINARLRAAGITVHEWSGWETRGNGQSSAYEGGIVHHTATPYGSAPAVLVNGRPDLAGPLCNYAGNADGSVTVIAAHPANHAGASGGRSMGPLPVTTLFNKRVLGLEIVYPGTSPMTPAQNRTALVWSRIVADVTGYSDVQRIRAHGETSITGKWDAGFAPGKTIDMDAFRADAALALTPPAGEDLTPDQNDVLNAISYRLQGLTQVWPKSAQNETIPISGVLKGLVADVAELKARPVAPPSTPVAVDAAAVATALAGNNAFLSAVAAATANELDRRAHDGDSSTGPVS